MVVSWSWEFNTLDFYSHWWLVITGENWLAKASDYQSFTAPPQIMSGPPGELYVKVNDEIQLSCDASGTPKPKILWTKVSNWFKLILKKVSLTWVGGFNVPFSKEGFRSWQELQYNRIASIQNIAVHRILLFFQNIGISKILFFSFFLLSVVVYFESDKSADELSHFAWEAFQTIIKRDDIC